MRICNKIFSVILILLLLFLPLCATFTFVNGYNFEMQNYILGAIILLIVFVSVIFSINKNEKSNKIMCFFIALVPIITEINWIFYISKSPNLIIFLLMVLCFISSVYLVVTLVRITWLQIVSIILSFVIFIPLSFLSFIVSIFPIGEDTVINILESPNKGYYAEIIDSDQGALGGNTFIDVYDLRNNFDLYLFKIYKRPQRVYKGSWSAYKDIQIYWTTENNLIIDGNEIFINNN